MEYKPTNHQARYVKQLFDDHNIKKAKGRLVVASNGGYKTCGYPDFGYRLYFNSKANSINVQVASSAYRDIGYDFLREYSVSIGKRPLEKAVYEIENAVLYNEYRHRVFLNAQENIK